MYKIIFAIHSIVDVITNSSTELFIIDSAQEIELVKSIIKEKEKEFPPEYSGITYVHATDEWELNNMFDYINEEEAVAFLKAKGYTVEKPDENSAKITYITISCERGCMNPGLINFIESTFTIIKHDTNG